MKSKIEIIKGKTPKKIKGLLVDQEIIFLSDTIKKKKEKNEIIAHELGHFLINEIRGEKRKCTDASPEKCFACKEQEKQAEVFGKILLPKIKMTKTISCIKKTATILAIVLGHMAVLCFLG